MDSDFEGLAYTIILLVLGVFGFFWGFKRFKRKRLIENTPTSTIRGMAMGLVEILGKARKTPLIHSPLIKEKCVYYQYQIEEYRSDGEDSSWYTLVRGNSKNAPFRIEDETGVVSIIPKRSEVVIPKTYTLTTGLGVSIPQSIKQFMIDRKIKYRGLFGSKKLRFTEWRIHSEETVYILGTAQKENDLVNVQKMKMDSYLSDLATNPEALNAIDKNKDGDVDQKEWDAAVKQVEKELIEEEGKSVHLSQLNDVYISWSDVDKVFMISNHPQKDLTKKLFWQSMLGIYGGSALAVAMLVLLLHYFQIF